MSMVVKMLASMWDVHYQEQRPFKSTSGKSKAAKIKSEIASSNRIDFDDRMDDEATTWILYLFRRRAFLLSDSGQIDWDIKTQTSAS